MTHHSAKLLLGAIDAAIYLAITLGAPERVYKHLQHAAQELKTIELPQ